MDKLKDLIKQVAPIGVPPNGIHGSQLIRRLFFRQPGHSKYSKNLIEYEITELKKDENVQTRIYTGSATSLCLRPVPKQPA